MRKLRSPIGALLLAGGMSVAICAPAFADHRPDNEIYEQTRGHAGRDGAWSEHVTSCVGQDGAVYHRHTDNRADRAGETTRESRSGDPAACHSERDGNATKPTEKSSARNDDADALVAVGDITVSPGDIVLIRPP